LQVTITLETSETINPRALHPSRRGSPTITKVSFHAFRILSKFELNPNDLDPFLHKPVLSVVKYYDSIFSHQGKYLFGLSNYLAWNFFTIVNIPAISDVML